MAVAKVGFAGLGLTALGLLAGCGTADVSAGSEGDAVNLNRCFGADCGSQAQALSGEKPQAQPCGGEAGSLQDVLMFEPLGKDLFARAIDAKEDADGSVWAVQSVTSLQKGFATFYLTHHAADGALLGVSDAIDSEAEHTLVNAALAVDDSGVVTVATYSVYAENADSELVERLTLYSFGSDMQAIGVPRAFRGLATPYMAGGKQGSIWLAGNATGNATHGAIARISGGEPDWIQTAVATAGQGVGGISALTVADDGFSAVVARLNPKWSGSGPNITTLGISTFDATGKPVWTLPLPTEFTQGNLGALGGTAEGDLVVAGVVGEQGESLLVQAVSRQGKLGWSYQIDGAPGASIEVRRDSGRTFVGLGNAIAVIDRKGESCRTFKMAGPAAGEPAPWQPDAEYVLAVGNELGRVRVPE